VALITVSSLQLEPVITFNFGAGCKPDPAKDSRIIKQLSMKICALVRNIRRLYEKN